MRKDEHETATSHFFYNFMNAFKNEEKTDNAHYRSRKNGRLIVYLQGLRYVTTVL
jgi:hypothetical protein